ncbi:leucyl aminopeptidase family protein [Swingsia samuiensis]|uniref:Leucyl aminopeptidase family protein n=2 Tax=Swingsia samuiensis TaxID=1293412 RepID=A0A4Y6UNU3_9PROT|nr:leucyl aminopeptidase family protein [Swingsia samuiensis]
MKNTPELPFVSLSDASFVRDLHIVSIQNDLVIKNLTAPFSEFLAGQGFSVSAGSFVLIPGGNGVDGALFCIDPSEQNDPTVFGKLGSALPKGDWRIVLHDLDEVVRQTALIGFGMGVYRYHVAERTESQKVRIVISEVDSKAVSVLRANWLGRDLINTPANLLGPQELAQCAQDELVARGAEVSVVQGDDLEKEYPCLAAVGAGSDRASAVVIARWKAREGAPRISLVGKGVCFDTGGYDLKPASGMLRMKKDMGGAALMLSVMAAAIDMQLDVDLELRLGCVENSVSGHAMRPGDVLLTRSGRYVEVGNTDAEGRLVLCDLLAEASESHPDYIIDAATLTGAARVALGPDLPALFSNDDVLADCLLKAGEKAADPLWRLPLWKKYDQWLDSKIADLNNVTSKPMAGAITAALYLQRFIPESQKWAHIDTYGWNDSTTYGRPEGGETLALHAVLGMISDIKPVFAK